MTEVTGMSNEGKEEGRRGEAEGKEGDVTMGTNKQTKTKQQQGKIKLLRQWKLDGRDEQKRVCVCEEDT